MFSEDRSNRLITILLLAAATLAGGLIVWQRLKADYDGQAFAASAPREGRPGGYVSSAACRSCHPGEYESWHQTYHRTMTQYAAPDSIRGPWSNVSLAAGKTTVRLEKRGAEFWADVTDPDWLAQHEPVRNAPRVQRRVDMVTGSHHMQVYWIPGATGNKQYALPFTYLFDDQRWVARADTFLIPPGVSPDYFEHHVWNVNCLQCHATAGQPRMTLDSLETRVGELGIACEACHGPGEEHIALNQNPLRRYYFHLTGRSDPSIINPERLPAPRSSQICGQCHSVKWIPNMAEFLREGFAYRPGNDLEATVTTIRAAKASKMPNVSAILARDPDFSDQHFWSDGMVRVSGREYSSMIESPCTADSKFSCMSCHSMHSSDVNYQVRPEAKSSGTCIACHKQFAGDGLTRHTHHSSTSDGSQCMNCHMPYTVYGLLRALRSHQIDSPSINTTLKTGRPDACNLCHLDKTLTWTADHLKSWYGVTTDPLREAESVESAGVRWMVSGDAGQRALVAWSMGWAPAQRASGTDWMAPFLGILLEDPYAAVRYVAYHSLLQLPGFGRFSYDYVGNPETMAAARANLFAQWQRMGARANRSVFIGPGGLFAEDGVRVLLRQRNDRRLFLDE